MLNRLSYAVIGLVLGSIVAVILWWLYGLGLSYQWGPLPNSPAPALLPWLAVVGGGFGAAGFLLKEKVGDLAGSFVRGIYEAETLDRLSSDLPGWLVVVVLVAVVAAVWYFVAR
jgi:hypothetical protein